MEVKITTSADGPVINLPVGDEKVVVTWRVDSGAARTVMDEGTFKKFFPGCVVQCMPANMCFKNADGSPLQMLGFYKSMFWIGTDAKVDEIFICKGVTKTRLLTE